jgi:hypothetical protein
MLCASMSVDETLERYSIADSASPCTARGVLKVRVKVAPPWTLLWNWVRVHQRSGRPNKVWHRALLVVATCVFFVGLGFFMLARLVAMDLLATTEPPAPPAAVSAPVEKAHCPACSLVESPKLQASSGRASSLRELPSVIKVPSFAEWVRALLILIGPLAIAVAALFAGFMRSTLCEVYVVGLLPHEPFPAVEQFLARSFDKHVIAIRFLSESTKQRFFGKFVEQLGTDRLSARLTTLDVTHASVKGVVDLSDDDERQEYWSLVRYGIGLMLSHHSVVRQSAIGFTYKLHEWFFMAYFAMLGVVVALPSLGWLPKTDETQFPLMMVGLGVVWAATLVVVHLGVVEHLRAWERMTASPPFNGCPIYRYSEQENAEGRWQELALTDFVAPIQELGLPSDRMLEITLGIMLIIYLTALQIVK